MERVLRFCLAAWLCVCGIGTCRSQTQGEVRRLTFVVREAVGHHSLVGVVCRAYAPGGKLRAYALSDAEGRVSVTACAGDVLEFSYVGYSSVRVKAGSYPDGKTAVIELAAHDTSLREVTIKARPLTARSDTLIYNMGSFVKPGDTRLEDVLRKLPGIKVADDGTVSYQGKAINKFYIEGKDLLGDSYNQATKNMPVDAVSAVEVLENHQPVRMLQGRVASDKAALNIKLDKGHKMRPFGEAEGGLGFSPAVWSGRLFLTQILRKSQLMITGKTNNTGADLSNETKEHIDVTDLDAYCPLPPSLLSADDLPESLPQDRYLRNKSYSAGINSMTELTKSSTLRFNLLFYEDHSSFSDEYRFTYGGATTTRITQADLNKRQTLTVMPVMKYEMNAARTFVVDELRYSFSRMASRAAVTTDGAGLHEDVTVRPTYVRNYFTAAFPAGKEVVEAKSLLRYFRRSGLLADAADSVALYNARERYAMQSLSARTKLSTSFALWGHTLRLSAACDDERNAYDDAGRVRKDRLLMSVAPTYIFSFGSDRGLTLDLPVEWLYVTTGGRSVSHACRSRFLFAPDVAFDYRFSDKWKLSLSASLSADDFTADFYSPYALRTSYRSVYIPSLRPYLDSDVRLSARAGYRNLATMFFANLAVSYSDGKRECYTHYDYTDSLTTMSVIGGDNHRRMLIVDASADKNFTAAGLSLKSELSYDRTSYLLSQSGLEAYNTSHVFAAKLDADYRKLRWLRLMLGATATLYWERNGFDDSGTLSALACKASLYLFPFKGLNIKAGYQDFINEVAPSHYHACGLLDVAAGYKIGKRWEVGSSVTNLLDVRQYVVVRDSGIDSFYSSLPLRGREVLFTLMFRM